MDATITYDEVAALVGNYIPTLEPHPNFKRIRTLRRHFERALQQQLNASAPTSGHQGYAPALPFHHNAFNALAADDSDKDTANTTATQMAALTYQSQLTAATAANTSERMDQYVHTPAQQQEQLQQTQHQLMVQLAALTLNHGEG
jgi:hypothetical protein